MPAMRLPVALSAAALALAAGLYFGWVHRDDGLSGRVTWVRDGDTFEIGRISIRLWGVDCPEIREAGGRDALLALKRLVGGREVRCERRQKLNSYDRVVAQCFVRGADVGGLLVESGVCQDWPRYSGGAYGR